MTEKISGVVDSIIYHDDDSGYCVVKIVPEKDHPQAQGHDGAVTVVGTMPTFKEGESVQFTGEWDNNRRYGMQFKANMAHLPLPKTEEEIVNYLSSSAVKGVGPVAAALIVDHFGEATIEMLDEQPNLVYGVPGLKPVVIDRFLKDWHENHVQRHALVYLQEELGLNGRLARQIYSKYGVMTRRTIRTDPYRLATDEFLTFKKADMFARKLGVADGHRARLRAGLLQAMNDFAREGHTFAPRPGALARAANLLRLEDDGTLEEALNDLLNSERLGEEELESEAGAKPIHAIYLPRFWHAENEVADKLRAIALRSSRLIHTHRNTDWTRFLADLRQSSNLMSSAQQEKVVRMALTSKVSVLTGGPGTGKTTTLQMLINALREADFVYKLAAPTGRAARRLSDATENIASTIHRLLQWDPESGGFTYHQNNRLQIDVVIIDEASMLDLRLFNSLLKALPLSAHLMLVGDIGQLPSVGAGNVLSDVINCGFASVTSLYQVFRQGDGSHIVSNAHRINQGKYPIIENKADDDFFFSKIFGEEEIANMVVDIVKRRVPKHWGLDPARDIQVIAPMKRGVIGVNNLNSRLQQALNGASLSAEVKLGNFVFRVGDKVMQTRNDYEKDVYNGDIGFIQSINTADKSLKIKFDYGDQGRFSVLSTDASEGSDLERFLEPLPDSDLITYQFSETENLTLAYCITVHKTQGSEFPVVVLPVHSQQSRMLQRNLLYTAITRAKQLVVLVGTPDALQKAVDSNDVTERHSGLLHRLRA